MKIQPKQLKKQLADRLAPVYLIASDEIQLQNDAADAVRAAAKKQGFLERDSDVLVERKYDWSAWLENAGSMSLFSSQKLIELRLSTAKIGSEGSEALCRYLEHGNPDTVLLLLAPRLDASTARSKWVKAIEKHGVHLPLYPLQDDDLKKWVAEKARKEKLKLDDEALNLLIVRSEGNLVTAQQELKKLTLVVSEDEVIDRQKISDHVNSSAQFNVFNLLDHATKGDSKKSVRALRHLREQGTEIPGMTTLMSRHIKRLIRVSQARNRDEVNQVLMRESLTPTSRRIIEAAKPRLSQLPLHKVLELTALADSESKKGESEFAWQCLESGVLLMCGHSVPLAELQCRARSTA